MSESIAALCDRTRQSIDARYEAALQALRVIEEYLGCRVTMSLKPLRPRSGEMCDAVIKSVEGTPLTVDEIRLQTGLSSRQVRGVISRKDLRSRFVREQSRDGYRYKFNSGREQTAPLFVSNYLSPTEDSDNSAPAANGENRGSN